MARPVTCECGSCSTCFNREKKRKYAAKNPEKVRAIARRNTAQYRARLRLSPEAHRAWLDERNVRQRARYAAAKRAKQLELADAQDMGPIHYSATIEEWVRRWGPIGSHGKAAYWSCI
jgi:Na+-translocating ferredoxin:NAD+ oxidoreductase RnfC subunit